MAYPVTADVTARLTLAGVSYGAADVAATLAGVIRDFERRTGREPFIAETETNYFDPPTRTCDGYLIDLRKGLLTVTSITIGLDQSGSGGSVLTVGTEYQLLPYNAGSDTKPYEFVRLMYGSYGLSKSIKIIGSWGYAATCPADVFDAIADYAAAKVVQKLQAYNGATERVKQGPVEVSYSTQAGRSPFDRAKAEFDAVVTSYKRVTA